MATRAVAIARRPARRVFVRSTRVNHKKKFTLPITVVLGFVPLATSTWDGYQSGAPYGTGIKNALHAAGGNFGYDTFTKQFSINGAIKGLTPMVLGLFAHKMANRLGLNRLIANAGIPVFRI